MFQSIESGKGALVGDLIELVVRIVAKVSFRFGDAEFWTWAAIGGGVALALALLAWVMRSASHN